MNRAEKQERREHAAKVKANIAERAPTLTDEELVLRETSIPLADFPPTMRALAVNVCKLTMGELLCVVEQIQDVDPKKGALLRRIWERRRDTADLRATLARLKKLQEAAK